MPGPTSFLLDRDVELLTAHGQVVEYADKEVILHQDTASEKFYLICGGVVQIDFSRVYGNEVLALLGEGEFFGEVSFLDKLPTSATASAVKPTRILEIPHEPLRDLLAEDAYLAARFYRSLATTLARRIRSSNRQ